MAPTLALSLTLTPTRLGVEQARLKANFACGCEPRARCACTRALYGSGMMGMWVVRAADARGRWWYRLEAESDSDGELGEVPSVAGDCGGADLAEQLGARCPGSR